MNSNIQLNIFSNKFDIGIFYVFNIKTIINTFKILFIRNNLFSLKFVILFFWNFFPLNLDYFSHPPPLPPPSPPTRIAKLGKFKILKICWLKGAGGGG
jgi:hypothetical protein